MNRVLKFENFVDINENEFEVKPELDRIVDDLNRLGFGPIQRDHEKFVAPLYWVSTKVNSTNLKAFLTEYSKSLKSFVFSTSFFHMFLLKDDMNSLVEAYYRRRRELGLEHVVAIQSGKCEDAYINEGELLKIWSIAKSLFSDERDFEGHVNIKTIL